MNTDGQIEKSEGNQKHKRFADIKKWAVTVLFVLIAGFVFALSIAFLGNGKDSGRAIGTGWGRIVGVASGSFKGFTKGIQDGEQGGQSAKDTKVTVKNKMESIGNLEVLAAGVRIDNVHQYSDQYSAVYVHKANAIFSVDLNRVVINHSGDDIIISLPELQVNLYIDEGSTKKLAEWQKNRHSGDAEDGYIAYINSAKNIEKKSPEEITNYEALMDQAKEMAKKQVTILAESVCGTDKTIKIDFIQEKSDK